MPYGDDNSNRPLDDLEQSHHCEPGVLGKPLNRMRLRNGSTARLGVATSHAWYDQDMPVRGLHRLGGRRYRLPTSRGGHIRQRIRAVWRRQDATSTIPSPRIFRQVVGPRQVRPAQAVADRVVSDVRVTVLSKAGLRPHSQLSLNSKDQ